MNDRYTIITTRVKELIAEETSKSPLPSAHQSLLEALLLEEVRLRICFEKPGGKELINDTHRVLIATQFPDSAERRVTFAEKVATIVAEEFAAVGDRVLSLEEC